MKKPHCGCCSAVTRYVANPVPRRRVGKAFVCAAGVWPMIHAGGKGHKQPQDARGDILRVLSR